MIHKGSNEMNRFVKPRFKSAAESSESALAASLETAIRRFRMYPPGHPSCSVAAERPYRELQAMLEKSDKLVLSLRDGFLSVNGVSTSLSPDISLLASSMRELVIRSIVIEKGITSRDLSSFVRFFSSKTAKGDDCSDLRGYIAANGIRFIEIDTLRYELVGDDEKVVSAEAEIDGTAGSASFENRVTIEFTRLVREHPELLIALLSSKGQAGVQICEEYRAAVDVDKLMQDIDCKLGDLTEEQIVEIVLSGLRNWVEAEGKAGAVDIEETLFDIRFMIEKTGNLGVVEKIKRLVAELNLVEEQYVDLILEGRYSKERLAFDELERTMSIIDAGEIDHRRVRLIPKRLETHGDSEYTDRLVGKLIAGAAECSDDEAAFESACSVLRLVVESAINQEAAGTCDTLIARFKTLLSDVSLEMPLFAFICRQATALCVWLLEQKRFVELAGLVGAIHRFTSEDVACEGEVREEADDFILALGTYEMVSRLLRELRADFDTLRKVLFELLVMLPTQQSALALVEYLTFDDRRIRLFVLRVLSEYGEVAIRAFQLAVANDELRTGAASERVLPAEIWYRVRNVIFVAGNTPTPQAVELVEAFVPYRDPRVAGEVIAVLEKMGNEKSSRLISSYLSFEDDDIRRRAALALGNTGGPEALPYLMEAYIKNPELRVALASVIAKAGGEQAVDFLGKMLLSSEGSLKEIFSRNVEREKLAVIAAVSRIRSRDTVAILQEFRHQISAGFMGLLKSTALANATDQAIIRVERELRTGQNGC